MNTHPFTISGIGEIAIRCTDINIMTEFYQTILGLDVLRDAREDLGIIFFQFPTRIDGHQTILALFSKDSDRASFHTKTKNAILTGEETSLHHIALNLPFEEQEKAITHYKNLDITYTIELFEWMKWRGVFIQDPEGNTIELVSFAPTLFEN